MNNLVENLVKHSILLKEHELIIDNYEKLLNKKIINVLWDKYTGNYLFENRKYVLEDIYSNVYFSNKIMDLEQISVTFLYVYHKIPSRALNRINKVETRFKYNGYVPDCNFKEKMWTSFNWKLSKEKIIQNSLNLSIDNNLLIQYKVK